MILGLGLIIVIGFVVMLLRPGGETMTVTETEPITKRGGTFVSAWRKGCFGDLQVWFLRTSGG